MKYLATLSEDQPLDFRSLSGLGRFESGEGREVDLSPEQVTSLTGKGFDLEPLEDDELDEDQDQFENDPFLESIEMDDADDEPREGE